MLAVFNWYDLDGHSTTSLKFKYVAKQNYFTIKCPLHKRTYMHLMNHKQETSLNVRGGGDSKNFRGQGILRNSNCTNKMALSSSNKGGGGACKHKYPPS